MNYKLLFSAITLLLLAPLVPVRADILYNPLYVLIYAPSGKGFGSINVLNPTDKPIRLQLDVLTWHFGPDGNIQVEGEELPEGGEPVMVAPEKKLGDYLKITPKQFTLPAQQRKVVRLGANIPTSIIESGKEYNLLLNITEIGADRKILEGPGSAEGKVSYGLIINKAINAGTYLRIGKPSDFHSDLRLSELKAQVEGQNIVYSFAYKNLGNKHLRRDVGIKFYDEQGSVIYESANIATILAFPEATAPASQIFEASLPLPSEKLLVQPPVSVELVFVDNEGEQALREVEVYSGKIDLLH